MSISVFDPIIPHKRPCKSLAGKKSGDLSIIGYIGNDANGREWYLCKCERCGDKVKRRGQHLRKGSISSCGRFPCRGSEWNI